MSQVSQNGSPSPGSSADSQAVPARNGSDYLHRLGDSMRAARARRGMTRKMLARDSGVSERFLAQLESGEGNASILILRQIAEALDLPLGALLPEEAQRTAHLAGALELLRELSPANLARAHELLQQQFRSNNDGVRMNRIALIGLRGAGKSTIGKLLADKLQLPFFELDRLIEQESGVSLSMIFDMYGQSGFRRLERRCLEDLLARESRFVVATGGSIVSEPSTYERLLSACCTVWLQATPQEHMSRVIKQGDMRPMAQNPEAMSDLHRILAERNELYAKADLAVSTSDRSVGQVLEACLQGLTTNVAQGSMSDSLGVAP